MGAVQLEVQVMALSIRRAISGRIDPQAMFSVAMGLAMSLKTLLAACSVPRWCAKQVVQHGDKIISDAKANAKSNQPQYGIDCARQVRRIRRLHLPLYAVSLVSFALVLCHALVAFIMMFSCGREVWLIGEGCIDISLVTSSAHDG